MERRQMYTLVTKSITEVVNGWQSTPITFTGISARASNIFSICTGRVLQILNNDDKYILTIQFSSKLCFRYCNLTSVCVSLNSIVSKGSLIGTVHDCVVVECITDVESAWPVRVGDVTYYKADPIDYVSGNVECLSTLKARVVADKGTSWPKFVFDSYTDSEFSNGRGDD